VELIRTKFPAVYAEILCIGEKKGSEAAAKVAFGAGFESGKTAGAELERERIKAVEEQCMAGHEKLITDLKFDGATTGPEAAVKILKAEKEKKQGLLAAMKEAAPKPLAMEFGDGTAQSSGKTMTADDKLQQTWDKDADIRAEFRTFECYKAYEKSLKQEGK